MNDDLFNLPPLRDVIVRHGISARRRLGQHFLLDENLTRKIVRSVGDVRERVIYEVGAGPGGLTRALLASKAKKIVAVEKDNRCLLALDELRKVSGSRLLLREGDALQLDEEEFLSEPAIIVANLPYNISTELLFKWLGRLHLFDKLILMFQKEVGERITARNNTKAYSRISVMCQWRCKTRRLFDVPPRAFTPPPKVTSSVIEIIRRDEGYETADPETLSNTVSAAFGMRRKMLRTSLKAITANPEQILLDAGINPRVRAETLSVKQFCVLSRLIHKQKDIY